MLRAMHARTALVAATTVWRADTCAARRGGSTHARPSEQPVEAASGVAPARVDVAPARVSVVALQLAGSEVSLRPLE